MFLFFEFNMFRSNTIEVNVLITNLYGIYKFGNTKIANNSRGRWSWG